MNPTVLLLLSVTTGAVVLMGGIIICRGWDKSIPCTLRECLAWGSGFFVAMSVQIILISQL